jgi:SiaC family regulatory phosphoprotein
MQKLFIESSRTTPEINFSPEDNIFIIRGTSSPEDVRALYYPVIEWIRIFVDDVIEGELTQYSPSRPVRFQTDLVYFNSSSAKFLFDIFTELKRLLLKDVKVMVEWYYDLDDADQKEAGSDISNLVELEFAFLPRKKS